MIYFLGILFLFFLLLGVAVTLIPFLLVFMLFCVKLILFGLFFWGAFLCLESIWK